MKIYGILFLLLCVWGSLRAADVWICGERTRFAEALESSLKKNGLPVTVSETGDPAAFRLVILPPGFRCTDELAARLNRFDGALMVMDRENLGCPVPEKIQKHSVVDWRRNVFRRLGNPQGTHKVTPDGAVELGNAYFRDGSVYPDVAGLQFQPGDEGIAFQVSGGADSDLFSVLLKDRDGRQFVSYVPLSRETKTVFLRFADFLALLPDSVENAEFSWAERANNLFIPDIRPVPEKICGMAMGLSLRHLWWDKGGSCRIVADICGLDGSVIAGNLALVPGEMSFPDREEL